MQRGAPKAMQVLDSCTSAETRRTSPARSVGSLRGPSDMATRLLDHLRRAIGTVFRSSERLPVVANITCAGGDRPARARGPEVPAATDEAAIAVNATPTARRRGEVLQR